MEHDLQQVFEASWRRLVGQLYAVCGDLTEAEDVVAEAFARAAARRRMFERLDNPEAWLRVTAVNVARTRHRRRRLGERVGLAGSVGAAEPRHPHLTEDRLEILAALAQLPDGQREALALHYLADQPVADVAATLGVPVGTVRPVCLAEDAAHKPDFTEVLARGRSLARRRTATALTATVVLVAGVLGATQLAGRPQADPVVPVVPVPSPSPDLPVPPEPTATDPAGLTNPTAQQIIDDPESQLVEVHAVAGDPDTRVALWRWCPTGSCRESAEAVTLTGDGFESSIVPDATWRIASVHIAATGDAVVVVGVIGRQELKVVRTDGSVADVDTTLPPSPVVDGEVVAGQESRGGSATFWATDPSSAEAHAVPAPEGTEQLVETDAGQLRALTDRRTHAWSDDGGQTWSESAPAVGPYLLSGFVSSLDDTHVVVGGGDGATSFPFGEIRRLEEDGSWAVTEPVTAPMAYIGPAAVLPDGRFLVSVESWSDWRFDQPLKGTPPGIYLSDGDDWTAYTRVDSGAPFQTVGAMQPQVTDIDVTDAGTVLTAIGPDQSSAWTSEDLGATWQEMRAR